MPSNVSWDWKSHPKAPQGPTRLGVENRRTTTGTGSQITLLPQTSLELGLTWNKDNLGFQNTCEHRTKGTIVEDRELKALPINFTRPVNATWEFWKKYLLNQLTDYIVLSYQESPGGAC